METVINFACVHAHSAPYIFFLLLILAGLNFPISEDVILLTSGAIASTCILDKTLYLFAWVYAGCWISAWEAYWIGRHFGPKLYDMRWFHGIITRKRIEKLHHYYEKFGVFTFIVGRFFPGGVRNALFMTAGLGKMPFLIFIIRDGFACLISASTIFYIGFYSGKNHQAILHFVKAYHYVFFAFLAIALLTTIIYLWKRSQQKTPI